MSICKSRFQGKVLCKRHICGVDETEDTNLYRCQICNTYESYSLLMIFLHDGNCNILSQNGKDNTEFPEEWFQCDQCEYKSLRKGNLRQHIYSTHRHPVNLDQMRTL